MPTTWNPSDKNSNITLSNNNYTATANTNTAQVVRGTTSKAVNSGKIYLEFEITTFTNDTCVGLANASEVLNVTGELGSTANSMGFYGVSPTQATYVNGVELNHGSTASTAPAYIGMAINFNTTPPTAFVKTQVMVAASTPWNNSATDNPSTNTGGQALTGLNAGPYFPAFCDDLTGSVCILNCGLYAAFNFAVPTGYTPWDLAGVDQWGMVSTLLIAQRNIMVPY